MLDKQQRWQTINEKVGVLWLIEAEYEKGEVVERETDEWLHCYCACMF